MIDANSDTIRLSLDGVKARVEVAGTNGIVARVLVDGQRALPRRGGWAIPTANGYERLSLRGVLPGFQSFIWRGQTVYRLGDGVGRMEKVTLFAPLLLLLVMWFTVPIAVALFFVGIPVVKNQRLTRPVRIVLPVVNTVVAFGVIFGLIVLLAR